MKSTDSILVLPTYDASHYLQRAEVYVRAAEAEPDAAIRTALETAGRECQRRALEIAQQGDPPLDVEWRE
jgi:hypothetical protein